MDSGHAFLALVWSAVKPGELHADADVNGGWGMGDERCA